MFYHILTTIAEDMKELEPTLWRLAAYPYFPDHVLQEERMHGDDNARLQNCSSVFKRSRANASKRFQSDDWRSVVKAPTNSRVITFGYFFDIC